jgi:hypothetical protein
MAWTTVTDINPIAWYKADAITGLSDNDPIDTWPDSSGNGIDLTQTSTARPLYKTGIVNGLPVARFDGSDDYMSSGSFTLSSNVNAVVVYSLDLLKNYNSLVNVHDAATPSYHNKYLNHHYYSTDRVLMSHNPSSVSYLIYHAQGSSATFKIDAYTQAYHDNSYPLFYRVNGNGSLGIDNRSGDLAPTTGTAYVHIGYSGLSGSFLDGDISEIVIYEETSLNESVWLEGYLANKYGITLVDGHLFKNAPPDYAPATYNAAGGGVRQVNIRGGADQ